MSDFEYNGIYYGTYTDFKRCANKERTAAKRQIRRAAKWYRENPTEQNHAILLHSMERLADAFVLLRHCRFIEMQREKEKETA